MAIVSKLLNSEEFRNSHHALCEMLANPLMAEASEIETKQLPTLESKIEILLSEFNEKEGTNLTVPTPDTSIQSQLVNLYASFHGSTLTDLLFQSRKDPFGTSFIKKHIKDCKKLSQILVTEKIITKLKEQVRVNKKLADAIFSLPEMIRTIYTFKITDAFLQQVQEYGGKSINTSIYCQPCEEGARLQTPCFSFSFCSDEFLSEENSLYSNFLLHHIGEKSIGRIQKFIDTSNDNFGYFDQILQNVINSSPLPTAESLETIYSINPSDLLSPEFINKKIEELISTQLSLVFHKEVCERFMEEVNQYFYNFVTSIKNFDEKFQYIFDSDPRDLISIGHW